MRSGGDHDDPALVEPRRAALLAELRTAEDGLSASELAVRLGIHPNTVRWHLGHLADAGHVRSRPMHRGAPGRPRVVFEAAGGLPEERQSFRFLADVLAGALAATADGSAAAEEAGRSWGRYLVERPQPGRALDGEEAAGRLVRLLADHGFLPEQRDGAIVMRRCPFGELAEGHGGVICTVHLGILRGALEELGAGLRVTALDAFPEPGVCLARLAPARPPAAA